MTFIDAFMWGFVSGGFVVATMCWQILKWMDTMS